MTAPLPMTSPASDTDQLLDGLNPQQRQAVLHEGSPLLIVAGAGSGKTAVLTRRIAYLLAARDVGVGQVLAITFTNKAAAEMRERVVGLVGPRARSMWVSTFHSTCVRILRNQASLVAGLNSNFSIYDADDSRRLLLMIGKDMGLDTKRHSPRLLANGISNLKNELIGPEQAAAEASEAADDLARVIAEVYAEYQRRLRAANALDFDDLIGETVAVLQAFPQIAQYYRRRFRHILVDGIVELVVISIIRLLLHLLLRCRLILVRLFGPLLLCGLILRLQLNRPRRACLQRLVDLHGGAPAN